MAFLKFSNQNKTQEALVKALRTKNSEAAVRAFVQAAEALRDSKTEYTFPIALNTDITKYDSPAQTPSHINVCVEYEPEKGFEILYRIMNINDKPIGLLKEEELALYIDTNGGISIGASMAHGTNILEARLKMLPSANKPVSEITKSVALEVQDALVAGVIPENASIFMPLVADDGAVHLDASGSYAHGLRVKGEKGTFRADVSSASNVLVYPLGDTGLNKKGQLYFNILSTPGDELHTNIGRMDTEFLAFGEKDLSECTDAMAEAIIRVKSLRDEENFLVDAISLNYARYQELSADKSIAASVKAEELNRMAQLDKELREKLDEVDKKMKSGEYIDFVIEDPFGVIGPKSYILRRESTDCFLGADGKIMPGFDVSLSVAVKSFNEAVDRIHSLYDQEVYKRKRKQKNSLEQEHAMTEKYGLGATAIANNTSDSYIADLEVLKAKHDQQLRDLAGSILFSDLFTETYTVLDTTSKSKILGQPIKLFINPYMNAQEQDKAISDALSLSRKGDREVKSEVVETVKALMRDSMDVENATGSVSYFGMTDVFEILNEHLGQNVTIKENDEQWNIRIAKSSTKGRDFEFPDTTTGELQDLTELFVACHLRPQVTLTTEVMHGHQKMSIPDKIKGFFKGTIGEVFKEFTKNLLNPEKQQETISSVGALSPEAQGKLKEANLAIYNTVRSIQQVADARFEEYKSNELNRLAQKLGMATTMGAAAITSKAMAEHLISGDKKMNLVMENSGKALFGNADELAFYVAAKNDGVKEALGNLYKQYEDLAHTLKDNVSLSMEARKDGEVAVKKDLIFPKGKINKPILVEYANKDGKMVALPPHNISKEAAMDILAMAVEAQIYTPFSQTAVKQVDEKQMQDINQVLKKAEERKAPVHPGHGKHPIDTGIRQ